MQKPPSYRRRDDVSQEKEKNQQDFKLMMQNFAANNFVTGQGVGPLRAFARGSSQHFHQPSEATTGSIGKFIKFVDMLIFVICLASSSNLNLNEDMGPITQVTQVQRPSTPEEQKKKCLNCSNMEDFIKGLQGEIKRLQVSEPLSSPTRLINSLAFTM